MHARRLSFTTFNLYTLNRPDQRMDRDADGWTEKRYARNIAWTRFSIRNARVDVFGFQKLWDAAALQEAFNTADLGEPYRVLAPPGHDGGMIVCASACART